MPAASADNSAPQTATWLMYRALVGVGSVCGLLIVSVFVLTLPIIERNQAEALERAVFQVLPGATSKHSYALTDARRFRAAVADDAAQELVHAGYDAQGALVGIAIQGQGMGYQDVIRVLYGYDPGTQTIVGMQVLASKETPGLGDKIEKDPVFLQNFAALDVGLAVGGQSLLHPIEAVKSGEKTRPWQVDGITGATISSKAIANILRQGSQQWVPLIYQQRAVFSNPGGSDGQP